MWLGAVICVIEPSYRVGYLCRRAADRLCTGWSNTAALISPSDRQLVIVQYNTWCTILQYMPADHLSPCHIHFPRLHSSIQQPQPCFSAAACSLNELSAWVTILKSLITHHFSLVETHIFEQKALVSFLSPFPFLLLHSCLISSVQWNWFLCFCNSQFDFSPHWRLDQFLLWVVFGTHQRGKISRCLWDSYLYNTHTCFSYLWLL